MAALLMDFARVTGIPTLLTEQNPSKLGKFLPELAARLPEQAILSKVEFGCFENEVIRRTVAETGRKTILLAGIEAHVCIFQTGVQALQGGFRLHVIADAVSARNALGREVGLRRLVRAGGVLTSTEMLVFELLKRAGTPEFRELLPLIKNIKT